MDTRHPDRRIDAHVEVCVPVNASAQDTWARLVDWESEGDWMIATKVSGAATHGVGDVLSARTGLGPIGFVDAMEVVAWDPPSSCVVEHQGRVVRGLGTFVVAPTGQSTSTLTWSEDLLLPLGVAGRLGFRATRPLVTYLLHASLVRFARTLECGLDSETAA
jgi:hypothetical protein